MAKFDGPVLLRRFDPEEHINRWYLVQVQATLLDPVAVVYAWGSVETSWQQTRILPMDSWEEAETAALAIVEAKKRRGYQAVGDSGLGSVPAPLLPSA